jgi:cell wall assembly regulator SMI1
LESSRAQAPRASNRVARKKTNCSSKRKLRPKATPTARAFRRDFLGDRNVVELPEPQESAGQILTFELDGATQQELKYQNFSWS